MQWFTDPKGNKLKQLLQQERVDFSFNKPGIKNRILASINDVRFSHQTAPETHRIWNFGLAATMAAVFVLVLTLDFADASKPGDRLYFLDQLQEDMALKLTHSSESRVELESELISERILELTQLPETPLVSESVSLRVIEDTQKKLLQTVEETTEIKNKLKTNQSPKKLDEILAKLELLAEKQQKQIEDAKRRSTDRQVLHRLENNLSEIKKARQKARLQYEQQLNLENTNSGKSQAAGTKDSGNQTKLNLWNRTGH